MPNVNQITPANFRDIVQKNQPAKSNDVNYKNFGETISDFLKAVNNDQKESSQQVQDVIQGKSENLHEAMAKLEESKLSFQLMLEIRNKLLDSYKEIERMQV